MVSFASKGREPRGGAAAPRARTAATQSRPGSESILQLQQAFDRSPRVRSQQELAASLQRRAMPIQKQAAPDDPGAVVQRVYMEKDPAVLGALLPVPGRWRMPWTPPTLTEQLMPAMTRYSALSEEARGADPETIQDMMRELATVRRVAAEYRSQVEEPLRNVLATVEDEASIIYGDLEYALQASAEMQRPDWAANYDDVARTVSGLFGRLGEYQSLQGPGASGPRRALATLYDQATVVEQGLQRRDPVGYAWGDQTGAVDEDTRALLQDFAQVKGFMARKSDVLSHLRPLAAAVGSERYFKLSALKRELTRVERQEGFSRHPVIPMGILPTEAFFQLLQEGQVMDDYGVGLRHGELTHRIQWYAIIDAYRSGDLELSRDPIDLYKAMGHQPRGESPTWGASVDDGGEANQPTYSAPATLNRDLLESFPGAPREGPALPPRPGYEVPPGLEAMAPIGEALLELREKRLIQALGETNSFPPGYDPTEVFPTAESSQESERLMARLPEYFKVWQQGKSGSVFSANQPEWKVWQVRRGDAPDL